MDSEHEKARALREQLIASKDREARLRREGQKNRLALQCADTARLQAELDKQLERVAEMEARGPALQA